MNNDTIKGTVKKVEGAVESTYGTVTGNASAEAKGDAKRFAGSAQKVLGDAEDKVLDMAGQVRGFIDSASENISQATSKVNAEIHEKPVRSTIISLGIGFLLGVLLAR
jgi:uncharacterized protein YjbJ (UPF0337 family)